MMMSQTERCGQVWSRIFMTVVVSAGVIALAPTIDTPATRLHAQAAVTAKAPQPEPRAHVVVRDSSVGYIIRTIATQTKHQILFDNANDQFAKKVTVRIVDQTVWDALATALRGTRLSATLAPDGQTIVVRAKSDSAAPKSRGRISGVIIDSATGAGVNAATVIVQETQEGTITDDKGRFTLSTSVAGAQLLRVRAFGFRPASRTVEIPQDGTISIQVALATVPNVLSGVVTTATGTQNKYEIGNDIAVINADSVMQSAPIRSVTDLLNGRVPGLTVQHTSGVAGAPARIRLRGAGSVTQSNDPIIIVDGIRIYSEQTSGLGVNGQDGNLAPGAFQVGSSTGAAQYATPSPLDQIDPNSIATIEVFKGPSASALYGSDAANGVIVITTKRGRPGMTRWSFTATQGVDQLRSRFPLGYYVFGHSPSGLPLLCPSRPLAATIGCIPDSTVAFQALNDPRFRITTPGSRSSGSLTVSGGSGSLTYSLTGSASTQTGMYHLPSIIADYFREKQGYDPPAWMAHPNTYSTWGGTGLVESQVGAHGGSVTLTSNFIQSNQLQTNLQSALPRLQGMYVDTTLTTNIIGLPFDYTEKATDGATTVNNAVQLRWPVTSWLTLNGTAGLNLDDRTDEKLTPRGYSPVDTAGHYGIGTFKSRVATLSLGTTIPMPLGLSGLYLRTAVGGNLTQENSSNLEAESYDIPYGVSKPSVFGNGTGSVPASQLSISQSTYGVYLQPQIDFRSRLFLGTGVRFDGGSATGSRAGLSAYPKIDLSWLAIDPASSTPLLGIVSLFRPRLAYGWAGVQPKPGDQLRLLFSQQFLLPDFFTYVPVVGLQSLGNTQLRPERGRELEGGFDTDLLDDRISLSFTGYRKTRVDAIVTLPVAPSVLGGLMGVTALSNSILKNIGTIRSSGVNASLNVTPLRTASVTWTATAGLTFNRSKVLSLVAGQGPITYTDGTRIAAGYPLFGRWAKPILGYADVNHDTLIEPNEILIGDTAIFMGQQEPKYELPVSSTLTVGRFSFSADFSYQNGLTQDNQGGGPATGFQQYESLLANAPFASLGAQAAAVAADQGLTYYGLIQRVNTFRWQSLSMQYTVPERTARLFRVASMQIGLQANNLWLHTNYRGADPDVNGLPYGDATLDSGQLPIPRSWTVSVRLGN